MNNSNGKQNQYFVMIQVIEKGKVKAAYSENSCRCGDLMCL